MGNTQTKKLHELSFGLALGTLISIILFILGLLAWFFNFNVDIVNCLGKMYLGYAPTLSGSLIGAIWGFFDGFLDGFILIWLYNFFLRRFKKIDNGIVQAA